MSSAMVASLAVQNAELKNRKQQLFMSSGHMQNTPSRIFLHCTVLHSRSVVEYVSSCCDFPNAQFCDTRETRRRIVNQELMRVNPLEQSAVCLCKGFSGA
ncbi:hypothetical protein BaRGS_00019285 [Batillaria attramentaria]|uniref:Uncharacterized protein n=1 Tax=Batillaria attramentaria TaxID=370345 RepID=A0ABD0KRA2_9CAEN